MGKITQIRKFNPRDAYRRGGTLTKFPGNGVGHMRDRSLIDHHVRNGMDDDGSDTTSNFRCSPQNSQRSSARTFAKVKRLPSRPNTGNNRSKPHEPPATNAGGHYIYKTRRNSNNNAAAKGRTFYFNPTRSRVNDIVSSSSFTQSYLQNTVVATPTMPTAPLSHSYESIKSPVNMRPQHSRNELISLPPLELNEPTRSRSQQESMAHNRHSTLAGSVIDYNGSMLPQQNFIYSHDTPVLTPHSSNTSLSSISSHVENLPAIKLYNLDVRFQPKTRPPVKNTSSFLTTPRSLPFGLTKSYTDLYFSTICNKENKSKISSNKSPFRVHKSLKANSKKHSIK